jgi:hypothetical protein
MVLVLPMSGNIAITLSRAVATASPAGRDVAAGPGRCAAASVRLPAGAVRETMYSFGRGGPVDSVTLAWAALGMGAAPVTSGMDRGAST